MNPLVPVLYACVMLVPEQYVPGCGSRASRGLNFPGSPMRVLEDDYSLCWEGDAGRTFPAGARHEFRTKMEPPTVCSGDAVCPTSMLADCHPCTGGGAPFTDGDWQCKPVVEFP